MRPKHNQGVAESGQEEVGKILQSENEAHTGGKRRQLAPLAGAKARNRPCKTTQGSPATGRFVFADSRRIVPKDYHAEETLTP